MGWNPNTGTTEENGKATLQDRLKVWGQFALNKILESPLTFLTLLSSLGLLITLIYQPIGMLVLAIVLVVSIGVTLVINNVLENSVQSIKKRKLWQRVVFVLMLVALVDLSIRVTSYCEVSFSENRNWRGSAITIIFGVENAPAIDKKLFKSKIVVTDYDNVFVTSSKRSDFGNKYVLVNQDGKQVETNIKFQPHYCYGSNRKVSQTFDTVVLFNDKNSGTFRRILRQKVCNSYDPFRGY